jgi:hypothetical protein
MLRVTIDTNVLDRTARSRVQEAIEGIDVDLATTTVTLRERPETQGETLTGSGVVYEAAVYDESTYDEAVYAPDVVHETLVLGESTVGSAVLGGDDSPSRLEAILEIIGNGSFPKPGRRESLTEGERRQLRDAMILEAHSRDGRDILVSNDVTAFGRTGDQSRRKPRGDVPNADHDRGRVLRIRGGGASMSACHHSPRSHLLRQRRRP